MLNAVALAHINDLFVGVVYAGIDTDRHNYPIGSGSVTFSNANSYQMVVTVAFIEIETLKVTKKVQVLEDALCSNCLVRQGPYFCRFGFYLLSIFIQQFSFPGTLLVSSTTVATETLLISHTFPTSALSWGS